MILAACDLNERRGKHHLLQTSSQPKSKRFQNSVNVWNHLVSQNWKNERLSCAFLVLARLVRTVVQIQGLVRPYLANSVCICKPLWTLLPIPACACSHFQCLFMLPTAGCRGWSELCWHITLPTFNVFSYKGVLHDISSIRLQDLFKLVDVVVLVGTAHKQASAIM